MKNPHGVEPTPFIYRRESQYVYECNSGRGPIFGSETNYYPDIIIGDNCNEKYSCYIHNDGRHAYLCHPEYRSSLFVGTDGPDERNYFTVLDYEVFAIDYESKYTIDHICKYPDIIWECMENKDISKEPLKQFYNESELRDDLYTIHCNDSAMRVKISRYCFRNPSKLLPDTWIVNQRYDIYLRVWLGYGYKWELIYRASEHGYTAESFHEYCDDKGPTLIIIKSIEGWILGGYTTQSWKAVNPNIYGSIYYDMIYS